jgi:hypothetical protein
VLSALERVGARVHRHVIIALHMAELHEPVESMPAIRLDKAESWSSISASNPLSRKCHVPPLFPLVVIVVELISLLLHFAGGARRTGPSFAHNVRTAFLFAIRMHNIPSAVGKNKTL